MQKPLFPVVLAVWLLFPAGASAALKFSYQRVAAGGPSQNNTLTVESRRLRMDGMAGPNAAPNGPGAPGAPGAGDVVVLDGEGKKIVMIYPARKAYREITEADFKVMKERLAGARAQMAEQLKNMPPEQRKMMEQMMAGKMGAMGGADGEMKLKYDATGEKKKVAGFACETYRVSLAGRLINESCFAPWSSSLISKAEAAEFKKLAQDLQQMFDMGGAGQSQDFSKMPGVPVEERHFASDGKTVEWTNTLKSVDRGSVSASQFQVPAGYTKETTPMAGPPGGRPPGIRRAPHP